MINCSWEFSLILYSSELFPCLHPTCEINSFCHWSENLMNDDSHPSLIVIAAASFIAVPVLFCFVFPTERYPPIPNAGFVCGLFSRDNYSRPIVCSPQKGLSLVYAKHSLADRMIYGPGLHGYHSTRRCLSFRARGPSTRLRPVIAPLSHAQLTGRGTPRVGIGHILRTGGRKIEFRTISRAEKVFAGEDNCFKGSYYLCSQKVSFIKSSTFLE